MKNFLICLTLMCSLSAQAQTCDKPGCLVYHHEQSVKWYDGTLQVQPPYLVLDSIVADALYKVYDNAALPQPDLNLPKPTTYNWKHGALVSGLGLLSGAAYGMHETCVHHPWNIPQGWDKQFWDNRLSWTNKWKNGDPLQGAKFPGSNTWFVATTDGKHLTATTHRASLFAGGFVIGLNFGKDKSWEYLIVDALLFSAAHLAGFHFTYTDPIWRTP